MFVAPAADLASHCATLFVIPLVFDVLQGRESGRRSMVIVVSPLTSLMMEQRDKFATHGTEFVGEPPAESLFNGEIC